MPRHSPPKTWAVLNSSGNSQRLPRPRPHFRLLPRQRYILKLERLAGLCPGPVLLNGLNADEEFCMGALGRGAAFQGCLWLRPQEEWRMRVQGEAGPSV